MLDCCNRVFLFWLHCRMEASSLTKDPNQTNSHLLKTKKILLVYLDLNRKMLKRVLSGLERTQAFHFYFNKIRIKCFDRVYCALFDTVFRARAFKTAYTPFTQLFQVGVKVAVELFFHVVCRPCICIVEITWSKVIACNFRNLGCMLTAWCIETESAVGFKVVQHQHAGWQRVANRLICRICESFEWQNRW